MLGQIALAGDPLVVADQRMQVAVAGVEHVADAQAGFDLERADSCEHLGQLRPRNDAVLHVIVGRHAAHRGERGLPALPDARPLVAVLRNLNFRAARSAADRFDHGKQAVHFGLRAVELHDEHGLGLGGKPGCTAASAASMVSRSIISTAAGMMPSAMISDTAAPAAAVESNAARMVRTASGARRILQRHLRHDGERAFGSDERADQDRARACRARRRQDAPSRRRAARLRCPARDAR